MNVSERRSDAPCMQSTDRCHNRISCRQVERIRSTQSSGVSGSTATCWDAHSIQVCLLMCFSAGCQNVVSFRLLQA